MGRKSEVPELMLMELKKAGELPAAQLAERLGINLQYTRLHLRLLRKAGKVVREGVASPVSAPTYRLASGKKKSVNPKKASKK